MVVSVQAFIQMKIYINGDSHTVAAEAVNPHAFAEDDPEIFDLGREPHPDNLAVSWGKQLADQAINMSRFTNTRDLGDGRTEVS